MDNLGHKGLLSGNIMRALLYYDLFDYPLTSEEIFRFLPSNHVTHSDIEHELDTMVKRARVFKLGDFFSLQPDPALQARRVNGNELAAKHLKIASAKAKVISRFPFVRSVMVSGSLSKGYADAKSDIDFFVITHPGRIWITRSLLGLYRRIVYFNSRRYFCINYFIDEDHLEIEERNLFTATELTTLIPLFGLTIHHELMLRNDWAKDYYPNYQLQPVEREGKAEPLFKRLAEQLMNTCFPEVVNRMLMRVALHRWKRIYGHTLGADDFRLAFKSGRSVSKSHPNAYQKKVLALFEERVRLLVNSDA